MTMLERAVRQSSSFKRNPLPLREGNCFRRLLTARAVASLMRRDAREVTARLWPSDRVTAELVERAAVAPAMTTVAGWAAELAQRLVYDALEALGPASAAAQLMRDGLVIAWDGRAIISVPGFVADVTDAAWVAEGDPIPVQQLVAAPGTLDPRKIASIAVLTREMIESSNAETLVGNALMRAAGLALDAAFFDSAAASAARPAGIRNGISTTAPGSSIGTEGMIEDVGNLLNAVGRVGGPGPYALVAGAGRMAAMGLRFINNLESVRLYVSPALGNDMIAIACQALVAAISVDPDVETSQAATLHMSDTPTAVGSAAPTRGLFQTNSLAIKVRWPATWALRDARGVAWTTPVWK